MLILELCYNLNHFLEEDNQYENIIFPAGITVSSAILTSVLIVLTRKQQSQRLGTTPFISQDQGEALQEDHPKQVISKEGCLL